MNVHDFTIKTITGEEKSLKEYSGKSLMIVNVASKCGLTPQYAGLESLYKKYKDRGFNILGLPCNQFLHQEPGTESDIQAFCSMNYGVTFDLGSKIEVKGKIPHPLYAFLTGDGAKFPGKISWNFEKFLVSKNGEVLARFSPQTVPEDPSIVSAVESSLS